MPKTIRKTRKQRYAKFFLKNQPPQNKEKRKKPGIIFRKICISYANKA